ncbi:MAG: acetyl-CoA carboxylase carboxyl transferase subunit beta, partial [Actinomycetota bacterium]|nr:acetyl-CoA carboxylase carboxyl transferase subunit beta [Actinomycetota bacterium]
MDGGSQGLEDIIDEGSFAILDDDLRSSDPLSFPGYRGAIETAEENVTESVSYGAARIDGDAVVIAGFDFRFLGGSMGEVAGERLARALERAAEDKVTFLLRTATGGARMQEGMRALVQMPKVVAARLALADARQPMIAVLGHPTTGGVLASLGALADVTVAERGATIGFAGPRVVQTFTGRPLAAGSHTAESAFDHGLVDAVVPATE